MKIKFFKFLTIYGYFQSLFFLIYFLFILTFSLITFNVERIDSLILELLFYLGISVTIFLITKGVTNHKKSYFTPFLLIQLFVIIIAWAFVGDKNLVIQISSIMAILMSSSSIIYLLLPQNRSQFLWFNRQLLNPIFYCPKKTPSVAS